PLSALRSRPQPAPAAPPPTASSFLFYTTATPEISTLSLHDALPISVLGSPGACIPTVESFSLIERVERGQAGVPAAFHGHHLDRSEEHTSELQSPCNLVCRLLLEKKKCRTEYRSAGRRLDSASRPTG